LRRDSLLLPEIISLEGEKKPLFLPFSGTGIKKLFFRSAQARIDRPSLPSRMERRIPLDWRREASFSGDAVVQLFFLYQRTMLGKEPGLFFSPSQTELIFFPSRKRRDDSLLPSAV